MLQSLVNEEVLIRLKWGQTEYTGRLVSVDSYMNVQLSGAEEWVGGKNAGTLGQVLIRYVLLSLVLMGERWGAGRWRGWGGEGGVGNVGGVCDWESWADG